MIEVHVGNVLGDSIIWRYLKVPRVSLISKVQSLKLNSWTKFILIVDQKGSTCSCIDLGHTDENSFKSGMKHLLILMWIKVHYIWNTFTRFEFLNCSIYDLKYFYLFIFFLWKDKNCEIPMGFELMTYSNAHTQCSKV